MTLLTVCVFMARGIQIFSEGVFFRRYLMTECLQNDPNSRRACAGLLNKFRTVKLELNLGSQKVHSFGRLIDFSLMLCCEDPFADYTCIFT